MIVRVDPDYLEHASKSKYKGGFTKDGKNTSAYNHDYYIHNKEKWKDNEGNPNENPFGYEDKYEQAAISYDPNGTGVGYTYANKKTGDSKIDVYDRTNGYVNPSRKRNGGGGSESVQITNPKLAEGTSKREGSYDIYKRAVDNGEFKEVKTAKVYKRGEGIGGGPSGTKDYSNRSSVSVNKRKKGRKPVGKVWTAKY